MIYTLPDTWIKESDLTRRVFNLKEFETRKTEADTLGTRI